MKGIVTLTPNVYNGLEGPYNRRNVYGAAIAYGPILASSPHTRDMWQSVARFAFCEDKSVITELSLPTQDVKKVVMHYAPVAQSTSPTRQLSVAPYPNTLEVNCHDA